MVIVVQILNEAYNNNTADGGDGQYGSDPVNVDPINGTVLAAAYNTGNTQVPAVVTFNTDLDGDGLVGVCDFDGDVPPINNGSGGTLGIDDNEKLDFSIYPNPADTTVTIVGEFDIDNVEIYNTLGAKILTTNGKIIDVSHLNIGVYLLKIESNGAFETKMLIIK